MKTKRFLIEAAIFSIALALIFSGCGDSGGDEAPTLLGDEHNEKVAEAEPNGDGNEPIAGDEPVAGSEQEGEPVGGEEASSSSSEIAALPSSNSVAGLCAGFVEGTKREHYGKEKKQFCDERDGQKYVYVTLGNLTWMAENLNYETNGSLCANDDPAKCATYGRLYDWDDASTACPTGWHFASRDDWEDLRNVVMADSGKTARDVLFKVAVPLMAFGGGTDNYGFSALPGGAQLDNGTFFSVGNVAYFWTGTEDVTNNARAYQFGMGSTQNHMSYSYYTKQGKLSVRCVNDVVATPSSSSSSRLGCGTGEYDPDTQFCYNSQVENKCAGNPQEYDPALYECRAGKKGVFLKNDVTHGDETYEAVLIGEQTWLARNLNYETPRSTCSGDDENNCEIYGRIYDWADAMDLDERYNSQGWDVNTTYEAHKRRQGICPAGWRIPERGEWVELNSYAGLAQGGLSVLLATKLMDESAGRYYPGTNDYGFSALSAGSVWWATNEALGDISGAWNRAFVFRFTTMPSSGIVITEISHEPKHIFYNPYDGSFGFINKSSVRCIKD